MTKLSWVPDYNYTDDIKQLVASLDVRPSKLVMNKIHQALEEGSGPPVEELAPKLGYDTAKSVARTVVMNVYAKGMLKQWHEDGIQHCKRLAMEDMKTCPVCRAINGKEYIVRDLLHLINPQSHDTHPSCRCTFIPIISISTYAPKKRPLPISKSLSYKGNEATNVPIEYYTMLREIFGRTKLPFKIDFDPTHDADYERVGNRLIVNPKTLADEDLREIVYQEQAEMLWPKMEPRVNKEYVPLLEYGFARSAKSWDDPKELFINNFTAYKLGQMDNDLWSQAFFHDVEATS
jgi:SPP1 gp7 family putative phage head morphogenesis protein